jgi:uncharacterized protein
MLKTKIQSDLKEAMKASKKDVVEVLRSVVTAITVRESMPEKELKSNKVELTSTGELTDAEVLKVISKQVKDRKNSIQMFAEGNRPDLVEKEQRQVDILNQYLPTMLADSEVESIVKDIIATGGYSGKADMGKVMKDFNVKYSGQADGKVVSQIVVNNL